MKQERGQVRGDFVLYRFSFLLLRLSSSCYINRSTGFWTMDLATLFRVGSLNKLAQ